MYKIPYGRQDIGKQELDAALEVLLSDYLTQGPAVEKFEFGIGQYCGVEYSVAVNSATSALHLACMALDIGQGDIVWTSPNTFVASANCAMYLGASVEFVDIDPKTYNICTEALRAKLEEAEIAGCLPRAVIVVHFAGASCDMRKIYDLSIKYGFEIIEDASHALGATYEGKKVGCCEFSAATIFSFHPVKIITTCEGGALTTRRPELAAKVKTLRQHGITRDCDVFTSGLVGGWVYEQIELGYNYRMSDLHAAIGRVQLERIETFISARHAVADRYDSGLSDADLVLPLRCSINRSALHLYPVLLKDSETRHSVFNAMREAGVGVNVHYIPVYLQPFYAQRGYQPGICPQAEKYYNKVLSLPIFPTLSAADQDFVINLLTGLLE